METTRDGTIRVTWTDLGRPEAKGYVAIPSGGQLMLDDADLNYATQYLAAGYEPEFFVDHIQKWVPFIWKHADTRKGVSMICTTCDALLRQYQRNNKARFAHQGDFLYRLSNPTLQSCQMY